MVARNKKKIVVGEVTLRLNTKDPDWFVLEHQDGTPVARQAKDGNSHCYRQGTNPDYEGYVPYTLEYMTKTRGWQTYDTFAVEGALYNQTFLSRFVK